MKESAETAEARAADAEAHAGYTVAPREQVLGAFDARADPSLVRRLTEQARELANEQAG